MVKLFLKSLRAGAAEAPRSPQRAKAPYTAFSFRKAFSFGPFASKEKALNEALNPHGYRQRKQSFSHLRCQLPEGELPGGQEKPAWAVTQGSLMERRFRRQSEIIVTATAGGGAPACRHPSGSSTIADCQGRTLPQSPSAPAPSRREPNKAFPAGEGLMVRLLRR